MAELEPQTGIRLDAFKKIVDDIEGDPEIQKLFGPEVARNLVVVGRGDDVRLEATRELSDEETGVFMKAVVKALEANLIPPE